LQPTSTKIPFFLLAFFKIISIMVSSENCDRETFAKTPKSLKKTSQKSIIKRKNKSL
jgi:hypothetical protein